jgi:phosphoribosylamine--glycine ligase
MIVRGKPYVLEYNVRFGDPEAEVLLPRLESDWLDLFEAALEGRLAAARPRWSEKSAVGVVLAAAGYPQNPRKGDVIRGLPEAEKLAQVHHAGTARKGEAWVTGGGRVLTLTALGENLASAVQRCYQAVSQVHFDGMQYRKDIASRGLKRIRHG